MRNLFIAALCLGLATPAAADTVVRTQCYGDRCALYDKYGTRIGSVTNTGNGRYVVRDRQGRKQAKVVVRDRTARVEKRKP